MKQDITVLIKKIIVLVMAAVCVLGFSSTLIAHPGLVNEGFSNGFDVLFFKQIYVYDGMAFLTPIAGALVWIDFLLALGMVVMAIFNFMAKQEKKIFTVFILIGMMTVAGLYCIYGLALYIGTIIDQSFSEYGMLTATYAYRPLIWQSILLAGYIFVPVIIKRINEAQGKTTETPVVEPTIEKEEKKVEVPVQVKTEQKIDTAKIRELKELLDMGAITQEEYDIKKKEILGL